MTVSSVFSYFVTASCWDILWFNCLYFPEIKQITFFLVNYLETAFVTGQGDRQSQILSGQLVILAGHCPMTGRYFGSWCYWYNHNRLDRLSGERPFKPYRGGFVEKNKALPYSWSNRPFSKMARPKITDVCVTGGMHYTPSLTNVCKFFNFQLTFSYLILHLKCWNFAVLLK